MFHERKLIAPSHLRIIPEVEVPFLRQANSRGCWLPSHIASEAQQTASYSRRFGTRRSDLGRKYEDSVLIVITPVPLYAVWTEEYCLRGYGCKMPSTGIRYSRKYLQALGNLSLVLRAG
ncbi:hypothetical protein Tco_0954841 [Tanacetum coccineum]|uniref:Uncharacterized protein n=1 Tax=Tanacetum coccineum TaxID=301880 RepID=A0ABQ5E5J3_9ASTR